MAKKAKQISFSIKWKILILVIAVYFLPMLMLAGRFNAWIIVLLGPAIAVLVTWWFRSRVAEATEKLEQLESRLPITPEAAPKRTAAFSDELTALVHTYDRFISSLEETYSELNAPAATGTGPFRREGAQTIYKAALATGDPVGGRRRCCRGGWRRMWIW